MQFMRLFVSFFSTLLLQACFNTGVAQMALGKGDVLRAGAEIKVLNSEAPVRSMAALQKDLTIIDFFATWCVPCVRALPHLKKIQEQAGSQVSVVLISNETEDRLAKFLDARKDFSFPVVVDKENVWNAMFQPPYLPYTAVVNKEGRILAITEAASITPQMIQAWLQHTDSLKTPTCHCY